MLWAPDAKSRLTEKDSDVAKEWRQNEKWVAEMRWLDSITDSMDMNFEQIVETAEDWGAYSPWGHKELDTT